MQRAFANPKRLHAMALVPILAVYTGYVSRFWFVTDDAYISFRYARNLARGQGLRYNLGTEPPVEGFSNFLWILLTAPVEVLGGDPGLYMPLLSASLGALLLVGVYATLVRHFHVHAAIAWGATLSLALTPMFTVWATGGLATMALALCVFATFERFALARRPNLLWSVVSGLSLALIRTEGVAWLIVIALLAAGSRAWDIRRRDRPLPASARTSMADALRAIWAPLVFIVPVFIVYFALRTWYFEDWVSNVARAKVALGPKSLLAGGKYVLATGFSTWLPLLALLGLPAALRRRHEHGLLVFVLFAAFPIWSIVVGGDYLPFGRQLLPAAPFGALLIGLWTQDLWRRFGAGTALGALVATCILAVLPAHNLAQLPHNLREPLHFRTNTTRVRTELDQWQFIAGSTGQWRALGEAMATHAQADGSWVIGAIGAKGYFSDLFIYDVGGLVNRQVAQREQRREGRSPGHEKTVPRSFFLPEEPTYLRAEIVLGNRRTVKDTTAKWNNETVRSHYQPRAYPLTPGTWLLLLERTETANPGQWRNPMGEPEDARRTRRAKGRWHEVQDLTDAQQRQIRQLEALGYSEGTAPSHPAFGVDVHTAEADSGYRLYTSGHEPMAGLIDAAGILRHQWQMPFNTAFPTERDRRKESGANYFRRAWLLPEGHLLALYEGIGLVRLNAESQVVWASALNAHHDVALLDDDTLAVLTRQGVVVPDIDPENALLEDFISIVDLDSGAELERLSLLTAVRDSDHAYLFDDSPRTHGDIFHTNSLEVLDGSQVGVHPAFARGNFLLSSRILNAVFVVDRQTHRVIWSLRGPFKRQHDPHLLDNGDLLLFDNVGLANRHSRALRLDPLSGDIRWSYPGPEDTGLFSRTCGLAQPLPNGSIRLVVSAEGRALDVDEDGTTLWSWRSPHRIEQGTRIATLFQMDPVVVDSETWMQPPTEDAQHVP